MPESDASAPGASARAATNVLVALHAGAFAAGTILQHALVRGPGGGRGLAVAIGLAAFAGVLAASLRKPWLDLLASSRFGAVSLVTIALFSILGTVVVQGQPEQVLAGMYGGLATVVTSLFLDDVFHSLGFSAVIGMAAGSMVAAVARTRKLTARRVGLIGAHLGAVSIIAGAAAGSVWGVKGRLEMRVNDVAGSFAVPDAEGRIEEIPLGYDVRLDGFDLLRYDPEFRLRIFDTSGSRERMIASLDPAAPGTPAALLARGVRLEGWWPDHVVRVEAVPLAAGPAGGEPLAAIGLSSGDRDGETTWLLDPGSGTVEPTPLPGGGGLVFVWGRKRAEAIVASTAPGAAPTGSHVLEIGGERIEAKVGGVYPLPGGAGSVKVIAAFKDFLIDPETRKATERSDEPNNPALRVEVVDASGATVSSRWLFARFPGFDHGEGGGPGLGYSYEGATGFSGGVILVGEAGEAWTVSAGAISSRAPMTAGGSLSLPGATTEVVAIHESASAIYRHETLSEKAMNPIAQVRVEGSSGSVFLAAGKAVEISGDEALALTAKGDEVRDFLSRVTVMEDGAPVRTATVEVNHPLSWGGFSIYQSGWDPEDPDYSGFEVVRDPGLPLVYGGFVVMILAVAWIVVGIPLLGRARPAAAAPAGGDGGAA